MDYKSNILEIGSKIKLEDALTVDKVSNYVGIGVASPEAKLDIAGTNSTLALSYGNTVPNNPLHTNYYGGFSGIGMDSASAGVRIVGDSYLSVMDVGYYTSGVLQHANWNSLLKVLPNGNVGIKNTNPQAPLSFKDNIGNKIDFYHNIFTSDRYGIQVQNSELRIHSGEQGANTGGITFGKSTTSTFTEHMRVRNDGYVGIGTTSPQEKLHVNGNLGLGTSPTIKWTSNTLRFEPFGDYIPVVVLGGTTSYAPRFEIKNAGDAATVVMLNGSGNSYINSGNVGIGITSPSARLDIASLAGDNDEKLQRWTYYAPSAPYYYLDLKQTVTSGVVRYNFSMVNNGTAYNNVLVLDRGNVGIGTTDPSARLTIKSITGVGGGGNVELQRGADRSSHQNYLIWNSDSYSDEIYIGTAANSSTATIGARWGDINFQTGSYSERMRITSAGNVGIGTTSPQSNLHVIGTGTESNPSVIRVTGTDGSTAGDAKVIIGQTPTSGDMQLLVAGTDSRTDGLTANDQYVIAGQRLNLFSKGNGSTYNTGITIGQSGGGAYDSIAFKTAAQNVSPSTRMFINGSGNVGIGTTNPIEKLDVVGTGTQLGTSGYYYNTRIKDDVNSGVVFGGNDTENGVGFVAGINSLAFLTYGSGWGEKMRIDTNGNVGIGTTSPIGKLNIQQSTLNIPFFFSGRYNNEDGPILQMGESSAFSGFASFGELLIHSYNRDIVFSTQNQATFSSVDEAVMIIEKTNGNVGIGTTSPAGKLDVAGKVILSGDTEHYIEKNTTSFITGASVETTTVSGRNIDLYAYNDINFRAGPSDKITMYAGGSERVRIASSGNVGINTTNPLQKLHVGGAVYSTGGYFTPSATTAYFANYNSTAGMIVYSSDETEFISGGYSTMKLSASGTVGIRKGFAAPGAMLDVNGGIRMGDDTAAASSTNVGTLRYRADANNSYVDMCMQTGASTYAWVNIKTNTW